MVSAACWFRCPDTKSAFENEFQKMNLLFIVFLRYQGRTEVDHNGCSPPGVAAIGSFRDILLD
jgi:hypothetical protein